jgi:DNA invertase Pin-like site-specific DNA recombinase
MNKVYTYARTSTDKQGNSIDYQGKVLAEFCNRKGFANVIELIDEDVSGGMQLFSRPQGSKLADAKKGDTIIVTHSTRLFRNFRDSVCTALDFIDNGINLIILDSGEEPISKDIQREMMMYISFLFAHVEKRQIGERTRNGLRNRRNNGQTNSREKFGYTNISKGKEGKEVINEEEVKILRVMNEKRELGYSYSKIAKHLNDNQLYTKKGTKWFHGNIPDMIDNFKDMVSKGLVTML